MYKQNIIGGRYFTLKKIVDNGIDTFMVNISDVIETLKEFDTNSSYKQSNGTDDYLDKQYKMLSKYIEKRKFTKAIIACINIIIKEIKTNDLYNCLGFINDHSSLIGASRIPFVYENVLSIGDKKYIFNYTIKDCSWNKSFTTAFAKKFIKFKKGN